MGSHMLDASLRPRLDPVLTRIARGLQHVGVTPMGLTLSGLVLGLAAAGAAALAWWWTALGLWLVSRLFDGLDGPLARLRGGGTAFGGYVDFVADLTVYGAFVVGCAVGQPDATLPLLVLLLSYYVNGASLLAYSAAAERARIAAPDERSLHFTRGLAEGTETILAHSLFVLLPAQMGLLAWAFSAVVAVTVVQRLVLARRVLRSAELTA